MQPITIGELTALDPNKTWRLDWIGNVKLRGQSHVQHQVELFFSPLLENSGLPSAQPRAADSQQQHQVNVGVGYLPILHLGILIRRGQIVPRPDNQIVRKRFRIRPRNSSFIFLGQQLGRAVRGTENMRALTAVEYEIGPRAWPHAGVSSLLTMSDIDGIDPYYALIPCMEVARFFFCPTSVLARGLFASAWQELLWMNGSDTSGLPDEITVGMKTVAGLGFRESRHLAFYLASDPTRQAVHSVYQSLQSHIAGRASGLALKCGFPFEEDTEIEAEVIPMMTGTTLEERYFVTRLLQCERPIPFANCFANPILNPEQGENWNSEDLLPMAIGSNPADTGDGDGPGGRSSMVRNLIDLAALGLVADDLGGPAAGLTDVVLASPEVRFPGLAEIPVEFAPKGEQRFRNASAGGPIPVNAAGMSTGTPQGSRPVLPATIDTDTADPADDVSNSDTVQKLTESVAHLCQSGFNATLLPALFLSRFDMARQGQRAWSRVLSGIDELGRRRYRGRLLVALVVRQGDRLCVVAEIERRSPAERFGFAGFYLAPSARPAEFLDQLAREVVIRSGWPRFDRARQAFQLGPQAWVNGRRALHVGVEDSERTAGKIQRTFLLQG